MKVLFVNPNYRDIPNLIPLGIGYIASVLRERGHEVACLDCNGFQYTREETAQKIFEYEFDALGIGGLTTTYGFVKWFSKVVKSRRPEVPIFAGNMVSTAHPGPLLENSSVDIAVIDEGEITTAELIEAFEEKRPLNSVAGIWYKKDGQIVKTACRARIKDLDNLPFPAWDLFPIDTYIRNPVYGEYGRKSLNVSTVRGCPYNCNFCSRPYGRVVTHRSPPSIVSEIIEVHKRFGANHIAFSDDLSFFSQKHMYGVCDEIIKAGLHKKITWNCSARANLVDYPILKKMKQA